MNAEKVNLYALERSSHRIWPFFGHDKPKVKILRFFARVNSTPKRYFIVDNVLLLFAD
jgi:hypothetical protein